MTSMDEYRNWKKKVTPGMGYTNLTFPKVSQRESCDIEDPLPLKQGCTYLHGNYYNKVTFK